MADDKERNEETEETEGKEPAKAKKKLPIVLLIGIVVGVLVLGGGGYYFYTTMGAAEAQPAEEVETLLITETNLYYSGFQTNIVNLAASDESAYLYIKYGFDLEVLNSSVIQELSEKLPRMTALIAGVMSDRQWSEIATAQGRDRLARELVREMNNALRESSEGGESTSPGQDKILGLYFTTFVAQ